MRDIREKMSSESEALVSWFLNNHINEKPGSVIQILLSSFDLKILLLPYYYYAIIELLCFIIMLKWFFCLITMVIQLMSNITSYSFTRCDKVSNSPNVAKKITNFFILLPRWNVKPSDLLLKNKNYLTHELFSFKVQKYLQMWLTQCEFAKWPPCRLMGI